MPPNPTVVTMLGFTFVRPFTFFAIILESLAGVVLAPVTGAVLAFPAVVGAVPFITVAGVTVAILGAFIIALNDTMVAIAMAIVTVFVFPTFIIHTMIIFTMTMIAIVVF
jgi:hypothetical protein